MSFSHTNLYALEFPEVRIQQPEFEVAVRECFAFPAPAGHNGCLAGEVDPFRGRQAGDDVCCQMIHQVSCLCPISPVRVDYP